MAANSGSRGKGEISEIRLEPMPKGQGVISHTESKFKRGGQGGGPMNDYETEKNHHPDEESLHAHIKAKLGHCFAEQGTNPAEKAGEEE
jgi:hypothetical protein